MSRKGIRLAAGGIVIVAVLAVVLWVAIGRGGVYYYNVAELRTLGSVENVRVSGTLVQGSVSEEAGRPLSFVISDRQHPDVVIPVSYSGPLPNTFSDTAGVEIVAQGDYTPGGIFRASTVLGKCPSKYEAGTGAGK